MRSLHKPWIGLGRTDRKERAWGTEADPLPEKKPLISPIRKILYYPQARGGEGGAPRGRTQLRKKDIPSFSEKKEKGGAAAPAFREKRSTRICAKISALKKRAVISLKKEKKRDYGYGGKNPARYPAGDPLRREEQQALLKKSEKVGGRVAQCFGPACRSPPPFRPGALPGESSFIGERGCRLTKRDFLLGVSPPVLRKEVISRCFPSRKELSPSFPGGG